MKNWLFSVVLLGGTSSVVCAQAQMPPNVPEISSGLAPLAFGVVAGVFVLYHEWRKKK